MSKAGDTVTGTPPVNVAPVGRAQSIDPLSALALVTAAMRSPARTIDDLLLQVEQALAGHVGRRCIIWRVSANGTRMRRVASRATTPLTTADDSTWLPASGPVAEVLGARQAVEMGFADTTVTTDPSDPSDPSDPYETTRTAETPRGEPPRSFARFVPLRHRQRIVAVIGVVRSGGQPLFEVADRVVLDAIAERIEAAFVAQELRDDVLSARTTSIERRDGVMLREDLLNRLASVAGDVAFRYRFGVGTEYVSPGVFESLGYTASEFMSDPGLVRRIVHPEDAHVVASLLDDPDAFAHPLIVRTIARDGTVAWQFVRLSPIEDNGRLLGCEGLLTDVSVMKRTEAELSHQARSDPLTGLANRLTFREFAQRSLARIERHPGMVGVLYLDLTGFKSINDTLGHGAGDQAIVMVAQRLIKVTRREDVVARLGGDEFAVLMPDLADVTEATATAQRIIGALEATMDIDGQSANISSGIGVAVTTSGAMTPDELVNQADIALYQAKRAGRGRWQVHAGGHGTALGPSGDGGSHLVVPQLITAGMMRTALAAGDFRVHYLPIVDLITGNAQAVEALVRWQHPDLGLLSANLFIHEAEAADIIHALGDWVLAQACRHLQAWREQFGIELDLHINVTADQLAQPGFSESVLTTLASTGTAPRRLGIEVPEQVIAAGTAPVEATLATLHRGGVRIVIDHFGSGSSSLRTLRRIPVDTIKLDRSLVDELDRGSDEGVSGADISGLAVKLAASLGADVVAVGVERTSQLTRLAELGCTLFQGAIATSSLTADQLATQVADGRLAYAIQLGEAGWATGQSATEWRREAGQASK